MRALRVWVWAVLRQRWRATLVLSLLIGIAGAAALGAADGARRTQTAFPRMRATTHAADLLVSVGGTGLAGYYAELGRQPEVESLGELAGIPVAALDKDGRPQLNTGPIPDAAVDDQTFFKLERPKIVAGRVFDPTKVQEAMVDPKAAKELHLHLGSTLAMWLGTSPDDPTKGVPVSFTVVGVGITQDQVVATTELGTQSQLFLTPAFFTSQPSLRIALEPGKGRQAALNYDGAFVKLKPGTDVPAFEKKASEIAQHYPQTFGTFIQNLEQSAERVQHAIVPLAIALYVFAGLITVAIVFVLGQAIARQQFVEANDVATLRALGFTRAQAIGAGLARVFVIVFAGTVIAVGGALPVSLFMPIGPARIAETHTGFEVNVGVMAVGAAGLLIVLMARAVSPAIRSVLLRGSAAHSRPSILADAAARAGLAPPVTSGVRMAFEQQHGSRPLPLRSALGGSIIGLAALMAALTFATSLNRLETVPSQFGQRWDFIVDTSFGILHLHPPGHDYEATVRSDPDVAGFTAGNYGSLVIGHRDVPAVGLTRLKGNVYPRLLEGRAADKPDEIVLGTSVMRRLKTGIGRTITVQFPLKDTSTEMHVVGRAVFPTLGRGSFAPASLGDGSAVVASDFAYLEHIFNDQESETNNFILVKTVPRANRAAVEKRIGDLFVNPECASTNDCFVSQSQRPLELNVLTKVRSVPLILAGLLALFAAATLAHALLTSVRLRARELAVLKTMGFVRRQIRATVAWQTSALAATALLCGLPLGVIAGRAVWSAFAGTLGVPGDAAVSVGVFLVAIPATLLLANIIGALPARAAARTEAAVVLRTE